MVCESEVVKPAQPVVGGERAAPRDLEAAGPEAGAGTCCRAAVRDGGRAGDGVGWELCGKADWPLLEIAF